MWGSCPLTQTTSELTIERNKRRRKKVLICLIQMTIVMMVIWKSYRGVLLITYEVSSFSNKK